MELKVNGRNASGHVTSFNGMRLDHKNQYVEGSDDVTRNFVRDLPRLEPYTGANNVRISYEGQEYTLSFKFYTDEEKKIYKAYRDDHKGTGGSGSSSASDGTVRVPKAQWDLLLGILEKSQDPDLKAWVEANKPEDPAIKKARAALAALTPAQRAALGLPPA